MKLKAKMFFFSPGWNNANGKILTLTPQRLLFLLPYYIVWGQIVSFQLSIKFYLYFLKYCCCDTPDRDFPWWWMQNICFVLYRIKQSVKNSFMINTVLYHGKLWAFTSCLTNLKWDVTGEQRDMDIKYVWRLAKRQKGTSGPEHMERAWGEWKAPGQTHLGYWFIGG